MKVSEDGERTAPLRDGQSVEGSGAGEGVGAIDGVVGAAGVVGSCAGVVGMSGVGEAEGVVRGGSTMMIGVVDSMGVVGGGGEKMISGVVVGWSSIEGVVAMAEGVVVGIRGMSDDVVGTSTVEDACSEVGTTKAVVDGDPICVVAASRLEVGESLGSAKKVVCAVVARLKMSEVLTSDSVGAFKDEDAWLGVVVRLGATDEGTIIAPGLLVVVRLDSELTAVFIFELTCSELTTPELPATEDTYGLVLVGTRVELVISVVVEIKAPIELEVAAGSFIGDVELSTLLAAIAPSETAAQPSGKSPLKTTCNKLPARQNRAFRDSNASFLHNKVPLASKTNCVDIGPSQNSPANL